MSTPSIILSKSDYERISLLIFRNNHPQAELLAEELDRAVITADSEVPSDVVQMNSKVQYQDASSGQIIQCQLVFPEDADLASNKISVLAPIGAALIGLSVNQEINWPLPNGNNKKIRILKVE